MAAPAIDISSLSADQQAVLEQYTAVTNQEVEAAIPLLQRTQWNVQVSASQASYLLLPWNHDTDLSSDCHHSVF
jgi:UBA-like domain